MSSPFKPTSLWSAVKEKEINAFNQGAVWGATQWKNYHNRVVKINRTLRLRIKELEKQIENK